MGSLFDLAAGLGQYAHQETSDAPCEDQQSLLGSALPRTPRQRLAKPASSTKSPRRSNDLSSRNGSGNQETSTAEASPQSALSLLDETLTAIYEARQPQHHSQQLESAGLLDLRRSLVSQRSAPQLPSASSTTLKASELESRRCLIHGGATSLSTRSSSGIFTTTPLQNVFAQSLTIPNNTKVTRSEQTTRTKSIPPPPPPPPLPQLSSSSGASTQSPNLTIKQDPDMVARSALREFNDEIEQLPIDAATDPTAQIPRLQRVLTDKYLQTRLDHLPSTPFVLLAKRKIQHKIEQLSSKCAEAAVQVCVPATKAAISPDRGAIPSSPSSSPSSSSVFPTDQHEMLVKLARIPDSHVAKLSSTQQQMVHFAKRYDKILRLSSDELQRLPVSQLQLLQQLKQQLPTSKC